MAYTQITALWSGFSGSPGYTRFRFDGDLDAAAADAAGGRVSAFFTFIAALLPDTVTVAVDPTAEIHDIDGGLTGTVAFAPDPDVDGSGTGGYAAPVGAAITWHTGLFLGGREARGRTYIVPLNGADFEANGTLTSGTQTGLQDAADTLLGGTPPLVVAGGHSPTGGGYVAPVISASVRDKAAILTSRRD